MKLLILSDMFSLESWLIYDEQPKIMPAVYNFYQHLGASTEHSFDAILYHPKVSKTISFANGSRIMIKALSGSFHYWRKAKSIKRMYSDAALMLTQDKYDLVYGMSIYATVAARLGRRFGMLSVSRLFGSLIWDTMQRRQYWKLYTRFILQYAEAKLPSDVIICTEDGTEFDKALAQINPGKTAHMLYNGIDTSLRNRLLAIPAVTQLTSGIRMISIGRLTSWKRHDLAIELVNILVRDHQMNDVSLTILGKGEQRESLQKQINECGLNGQIEIINPIAHDELPNLLASYDVGLFLYDASNLGNAMWETSLSGRLICTRPTGKTADIYHDGVNALVTDDIQHMTDKILSLTYKDISSMTQKSREDIDSLLPSWTERLSSEMNIITQALDRQ